MFVLTIAAFMVFGVFSGIAGIVGASSGSFTPPHSDQAVDTDMPPNGLYDELIVSASVDVTGIGIFYLIGDLYDNSGMIMIDSQFAMANLALGAQWIDVTFPGFIIRQSGYDGPYQVDLALYDDLFMPLDFSIHTTSAYLATDFEGPDAYFTPPHSDQGIDNDGDMLWDLLVVGAEVTVNVSGNYELDATLLDATGMIFIDFQVNFTFLTVGTHTVDIGFLGYLVRGSGIDGPYMVELYLYDSMFNFLHNDTHFTNPYLATDFAFPPVTFLPPHSDWGWDTNGNLLYEFLVVTASVDVTTAGNYIVDGSTAFGWAQNATYLSAGIQTVDLKFYGFQIFNFGVDGPYLIDLNLFDEFWNLLDSDTHITAAYLFTDFEPNPPCAFSPPHWDYGLDTDGDSDYNFLVVNANLTVDAPGSYDVWGYLYDQTGMFFITSATNSTWLDIGSQTVDLLFPGSDISMSGIDGPYLVNLDVLDMMFLTLDSDSFLTQPYLATDFDLPAALFNPPHSDYALDIDAPPDGVYDFLVVNASILVNDPGWYAVVATLLDPFFMPITGAQQVANLSAGATFIPLRFSGIDISRYGADGPYFVSMGLMSFDPMGPLFLDSDMHMTGLYFASDFLSLPPATIWGYVYNATSGSSVDMADIVVLNGTYGWMMQTTSNSTGYYEVTVFDGDFFVVIDSWDLQSNISQTSVVGSAEVTRSLEEPVPDLQDTTLVMPDWDNAVLNTTFEMGVDNQSMRFMIDMMIGNRDGFVNQTELDVFFFMSGGAAPPIFSTTIDQFYVDGIHYDLVPGTDSFIFDLLGSVVSPNPPSGLMAANFTSNTTIPVSSTHRLEINTTYDTDAERNILNGLLPAGFNLWGYDPVVNVLVTGIGTPNFVVDPLMDPDPLDTTDYVWVNLTVGQGAPDTNAPQVLNVRINGQVDPIYDLSSIPPVIYLNATIDDSTTGNSPVGAANYTIGVQDWATSTLMNPADGMFDSPTEDVTAVITPPVGTTIYCVYGQDIVPNYNTMGSCTSVTVLDDLAPQISNIRIDGGPFAIFLLSTLPATATLNATIDDTTTGSSVVWGANYTTPLVDSWPGIDMFPVDMSFDQPTENVTANILVPTSVGVFDYYVHAWDADMNYNDSAPAVQITVLDDIDPAVAGVTLNGQPTVSVMPGTSVFVNATVDDTGGRGSTAIQGANYTIDGDWLTSTPLQPADGAFDTFTEDVTSTPSFIDTTGWPDADYLVCVYGWDDIPNYNTTGACAMLNISSVDNRPPYLLNVLLNNQPSVTVFAGSTVYLNATIDDVPALGSNILGANYTVGPGWPGIDMFPTDGAFDSPTEDVNITIDTTGWPDADYLVCVYGWDDIPNYNTTGACALLTIALPDTLPPDVLNVLLNNQASPTVAPGSIVFLNATIDDTLTMGSNILGANYTIDTIWPGTNMFPTDGTFDSPTEDVNITINTTGWADATYQICVYGWDDFPNYNTIGACAQLTVHTPVGPDTQRPTITNVGATPDPQEPGEDLMIHATVDDNVQVYGAWVNVTNPDGFTVGNVSMTYNAASDEYRYTSTYSDIGTHTFTIWANDTSDNWNSSSGTFEIQDATPPTVVVTVSNDQPEVGETVRFEATADDPSGIDEVRIEIEKDGDTILSSRRMTYDSNEDIYWYEYAFTEVGDYSYTVTATDENNNDQDVQGTITVSEEAAAPSFLSEYWWLIVLIIVIVVVVAVVGLMLRRKPKVAEVPPAEEELPPPPEEPAEAPTEAPAEEPTEAPAEEETPPPPEEEPKGPEMLEDVEG